MLRKAYYKVNRYCKGAGKKTFIYCNSSIAEYLDKKATDKDNVMLSMKEYCGEEITHYKGIPIRVIDQILETEERVL